MHICIYVCTYLCIYICIEYIYNMIHNMTYNMISKYHLQLCCSENTVKLEVGRSCFGGRDHITGVGMPTGHPTDVRARAGRGKAAYASHRCKPIGLIQLGSRAYSSGQIITTSAEVTLSCDLVRESTQNLFRCCFFCCKTQKEAVVVRYMI